MTETENLSNLYIEQQHDYERRSPNQIDSQPCLTQSTPPPSYHFVPILSVNLPLENDNRTGRHAQDIGSTVPAIPAQSTIRNYNSTNVRTSRVDLPTYEEALDPDAVPPPSYDSLFGRVREARKTSTGIFDFIKNIIILLLGTIGCTIILGVTIVIPLCMTLFGFLYLNDCPQGAFIPVYLLVGGFFGILKQLLNLTSYKRNEVVETELSNQTQTHTVINCFMLGWFIIGSYFIYKEYEPNYDPSKGIYCNKTLYLFSFYLITSVYVSLGIIIISIFIISFVSIILLST